jgi:hypothetical protein
VSGAPRSRRHTSRTDDRSQDWYGFPVVSARPKRPSRAVREHTGGLMSKILPGGLYVGRLFQLIFKLFVVPNLKMAHCRPHTNEN